MANAIYNGFKKHVQDGTVGDLTSAGTNVRVMLVTSSYSPDIDAHEFVSSVTNEVSGAGYAAGAGHRLGASRRHRRYRGV